MSNAYLLALSTSGRAASCAMLCNGAVLTMLLRDENRTHSETMLPMVDELLSCCSLTMNDINCFAVDTGPGSFTGVRIGVSATNAMANAANKPIVGVDSLLALREGIASESGSICSLIDARNGNGYAAHYLDLKCIVAPSPVVIADFAATLPAKTLFVGDGAVLHHDLLCELVNNARFACEDAAIVRANAVGKCAWRAYENGNIANEVQPLYLRPSQAERLAKKEITMDKNI